MIKLAYLYFSLILSARVLSDIGVRASYKVPIHWNFVLTLITEPWLHMRSGVGAYGTAFGVSLDTVSHIVSPVVYRSFFLVTHRLSLLPY
jgi:hypothetical protein